jgi:hypothetical protein
MRWSSMVRVGLSGTSLALAMMGCSKAEEAREEPVDTVEVSEALGEKAEQEREEERAEKRDEERELEARRRREEEARRLAERNASSEPSPWFLRGPGDTKQASVQGGEQPQQQVRDPDPAQPKPVQVQPQQVKKPIQPVQQRPGGWQHRAACGRG